LLKLYSAPYGKVALADEELCHFTLENSSPRNFRLRWLTQLIVRHSLYGSEDYEQKHRNPANITEKEFVGTCCKYVYQLIGQQDWRMALLVCQLIPTGHYVNQKIRRRLTFEVLQRQLLTIITEPGNFDHHNKPYLLTEAKVPQEWLHTALALFA
jgi:hypothetical protein